MDKTTYERGGFDWPRAATSYLIQLYGQYPCLYVTTSPDYHNRNVRQKALEEMLTKFNRVHSTELNVEKLKNKIHGLRTQYLAEIKKIKKSRVYGSSSDAIYKPKLWCFEDLHALFRGTPVVRRERSNLPIDVKVKSEEYKVNPEEQTENHLEPEVILDGDISESSDIEMDALSPSSSKGSSREESRPSSRENCQTPVQNDSSTYSRKFLSWDDSAGIHPEISNGVSSPKISNIRNIADGNVESRKIKKLSSFLITSVSSLHDTTASGKPPPRKHRLFGQLIAEEMEALEDEEILDELKLKIQNELYEAKKKQRMLKKT